VSFIDDALPCEKQDWIGRRHWRNGSQFAMLANSTKAVCVIVAWPNRRPQPGRPSDYLPEYVDQAAKLCRLGATDAKIADFF
jgi:hypothetical protein